MFPEPLLEQREHLYQLARIVERACGLGFYSPEDFLKFLENTECYMAVQDAFPVGICLCELPPGSQDEMPTVRATSLEEWLKTNSTWRTATVGDIEKALDACPLQFVIAGHRDDFGADLFYNGQEWEVVNTGSVGHYVVVPADQPAREAERHDEECPLCKMPVTTWYLSAKVRVVQNRCDHSSSLRVVNDTGD